jgi:hypothetical protein
VYGAAVAYFSIALGLRYGLANLFLGPIVYLTIHLGLGAGFLLEVLRWNTDKDRSYSHEASSTSAT